MNVFLSHIDWTPAVYGILMFAGLMITVAKAVYGYWSSVIIDVVVFALVFKLHGGTMAGGFSAMIAAMLAGLFIPLLFKFRTMER